MAFTMNVELPDKQEVIAALQPPAEVKTEMQLQAEKQVAEILNANVEDMGERRSITKVIGDFGMETMRASSSKNNLLKTRIADLSRAGGETGVVAKSLEELNTQIKELDPSGIDFLKKGIFGKVTGPIQRYFRRYERADKFIQDILKKLDQGRKTLRNDNTTLEIEQDNIRQLTKVLQKQVSLSTAMDTCLERKLAEYQASMEYNEDKAKFIQEEVLFPLRQRTMDLQALLAVNEQSYFAIEVMRKNNVELINAVDRMEMLTVTALRTAVMLASALYHQKMVLDCVNAVRETTNNLIASTSKMIKEQGVQIQQQATEAVMDPEKLRVAFQDIFEAMDNVTKYKLEALPKMKATITTFKEMADEGELRIQRIERGYDVA